MGLTTRHTASSLSLSQSSCVVTSENTPGEQASPLSTGLHPGLQSRSLSSPPSQNHHRCKKDFPSVTKLLAGLSFQDETHPDFVLRASSLKAAASSRSTTPRALLRRSTNSLEPIPSDLVPSTTPFAHPPRSASDLTGCFSLSAGRHPTPSSPYPRYRSWSTVCVDQSTRRFTRPVSASPTSASPTRSGSSRASSPSSSTTATTSDRPSLKRSWSDTDDETLSDTSESEGSLGEVRLRWDNTARAPAHDRMIANPSTSWLKSISANQQQIRPSSTQEPILGCQVDVRPLEQVEKRRRE